MRRHKIGLTQVEFNKMTKSIEIETICPWPECQKEQHFAISDKKLLDKIHRSEPIWSKCKHCKKIIEILVVPRIVFKFSNQFKNLESNKLEKGGIILND